jgi:origin recognition complex subunit 4
VVRLSGLAQTNDRLAIREMGRQIAEAEGKKLAAEEDEEESGEDAVSSRE